MAPHGRPGGGLLLADGDLTVALTVEGLAQLAGLVGEELPPTPWVVLDREDHLGYDAVTFHARSTNYPGGDAATMLHGSQLLAVGASLFERTIAIRGFRTAVLYGFDRVRFPAGVPIGARVRARFAVLEAAEVAGGGVQCRLKITVEAEDAVKPACVAEQLLRLVP